MTYRCWLRRQVLTARLLKFNNEVVYERLLTPHVPFALDYLEVMFSLCDVLGLLYSKFLDEVGRAPGDVTLIVEAASWRRRAPRLRLRSPSAVPLVSSETPGSYFPSFPILVFS